MGLLEERIWKSSSEEQEAHWVDILLNQQDTISEVCYLVHTLKGRKSQPRNYSVVSFRSVSYPGWQAGRVEPPERALLITEWTHQDTASNTGVTYLFARGRKKREFEKCASLIRTLHVNTKQCFLKVDHLKADLYIYHPAVNWRSFYFNIKIKSINFRGKDCHGLGFPV